MFDIMCFRILKRIFDDLIVLVLENDDRVLIYVFRVIKVFIIGFFFDFESFVKFGYVIKDFVKVCRNEVVFFEILLILESVWIIFLDLRVYDIIFCFFYFKNFCFKVMGFRFFLNMSVYMGDFVFLKIVFFEVWDMFIVEDIFLIDFVLILFFDVVYYFLCEEIIDDVVGVLIFVKNFVLKGKFGVSDKVWFVVEKFEDVIYRYYKNWFEEVK